MERVEHMTARLPHLYRDGELVRGLLAVPGLALEIFSEDIVEVRRAHFFDGALERAEVERLAALLDFVPEDWQTPALFRAFVHATRDAMLHQGAVTKSALQGFVIDYCQRFQAASRISAVLSLGRWSERPDPSRPAFLENPPLRRVIKQPAVGGVEPLHRFTVQQRGLDDAALDLFLVGLPSGPEHLPVIANLTTSQALVYLGPIPVGARLSIRVRGDRAIAELEGVDVTERLRSIERFEPGVPWEQDQVAVEAKPLELARGPNEIWFLSVAHYGVPGLDRALLALADRSLAQGRFDESALDRSLFYQDPAAMLWLSWDETEPARFDVELPGGALLSRERTDKALAAREHLETSLSASLERLRAAGVRARVELAPFRERQASNDRLAGVLPLRQREPGPTGADRLPQSGGVFEVTKYEDSTFR